MIQEIGGVTMTGHQQEIIDALKFELTFLDRGGYERSVREPRKALSIFQDSPSCPNYASPTKTHPCAECFLIDFVPSEKRAEAVPCRSEERRVGKECRSRGWPDYSKKTTETMMVRGSD